MNRHRRRGFTVVELIISVAILAMVMTAVATAFHSSMTTYEENDKVSSAMQVAQRVMGQIKRQIRTASDVDSADPNAILSIKNPADQSSLTLAEYRYYSGSGQLKYKIAPALSTGDDTWVLIGDSDDDMTVTDFKVTIANDTNDYALEVVVKLTFTVRGKSFTMTASGSPRRNL